MVEAATPVRVSRLEVFEARFPFRFSFGHALTSRRSSTNVLVRVETSNGAVGYGESVPRDYVTGETPEGTVQFIHDHLGPALLGLEVEGFEQSAERLSELFARVEGAETASAARCATELACLDAFGRAWGRSVGDLLGPIQRGEVRYSGVLPFLPPPLMLLAALTYRIYGVEVLKLKVGRSLSEDLRNLRILRSALGPRADLRVDANCAWTPDQAVEAIRAMSCYGIQAVEQPVAKDDVAGLKMVADAVEVPVMADESLATLDDARGLIEQRAVDMFNLRISKCGGLLRAREMAELATGAGLSCQLGCHPGESAILSAAGRHFAARTANLRYCEGSFGAILLKQDIAGESVVPSRGFKAPALRGPGLGIEVDEERLGPYVVARFEAG